MAITSLVLGVAGLLPILPFVGSVGAIACGIAARRAGERDGGTSLAGIVLGVIGLAGPIAAWFIYCVVLGYPFPIERYQPTT